MKKSNIFRSMAFTLMVVSVLSIFVTSCKKDEDARTPPTLTFKTDAGYTFSDTTVSHGDTIKVGVTAVKTEDELSSFNISYTLDGSSVNNNFYTYALTSAEYDNFTKDTTIVADATASTETITFAITDRDGNTTPKSIKLTIH